MNINISFDGCFKVKDTTEPQDIKVLMLKGEDGTTPQAGIDYFTNEEIAEITENAAEAAAKKINTDYEDIGTFEIAEDAATWSYTLSQNYKALYVDVNRDAVAKVGGAISATFNNAKGEGQACKLQVTLGTASQPSFEMKHQGTLMFGTVYQARYDEGTTYCFPRVFSADTQSTRYYVGDMNTVTITCALKAGMRIYLKGIPADE